MGSTLTVDNIKDSGDNTLVSSTGSGHTIASGVAVPAAGITGAIPSNVTGGAGLDYVPTFNATTSPAFAVSVNDTGSVTNIDSTWRTAEFTHDSGDNTAPLYLGDHLYNIGGMFDLSNNWFLPTVAGYYNFYYNFNIHNIGADIRISVRFLRSEDSSDNWYGRFASGGLQTSSAEQANFSFAARPVYLNGTTHRVFVRHQIHSGGYGFNRGSHQLVFSGWRVG